MIGNTQHAGDSVNAIIREPRKAAEQGYDLIVVGGGIYGTMLLLDASRRGLRALLVERDDFGHATTFNNLRTIHGGLRYLQQLDLPRFRESVNERRWFLRYFPDLVQPLACLMPLYGQGLRKPRVLRVALAVNDLLSCTRNCGVRPDRRLDRGSIIDAQQVKALFPGVDSDALRGGAIWHDACLPDSPRLLIELLRWSCELGATALNYVEARELLRVDDRVAGIVAQDSDSGSVHEFQATTVINAAGPWCRAVATRFERHAPVLFHHSLAWNILFNRCAISNHALAVTPKRPGAPTYFIHPWKGRLLIGTGHVAWTGGPEQPTPSEVQIQAFLEDLNSAVPSLNLTPNEVAHVFAGLLPAAREGSAGLTRREVIANHADHGGPKGLYTVSGVKLTTSGLVAKKVLDSAFPGTQIADASDRDAADSPRSIHNQNWSFSYDWRPQVSDTQWKNDLAALSSEEAVVHLNDLVFRRTTLWENAHRTFAIAPLLCNVLEWNESRSADEIRRLKDAFSAATYRVTSE